MECIWRESRKSTKGLGEREGEEGEALSTPDFRLEKQEVLLSERENVWRKNGGLRVDLTTPEISAKYPNGVETESRQTN